jgi:two-component system KDP operon response regulator KdpE
MQRDGQPVKSKHHILIVDDEPQITRVLRTGLMTNGFEVRVAGDGLSAMETFGDWPTDLVITDLSMPNLDGISLCRNIRKLSQTPIIVLSVKGEEKTKVEALDAGADDYITKPFGMNELLARIRAILRRVPMNADTDETKTSDAIIIGDFNVDLNSREVHVSSKPVRLTPKEFELLVYFLRHPNRVLTHHALLGAVWGGNYTEQAEYLRVFVGQLRKKIEVEPSSPKYLMTEPWVGYRFDPGA